jgi:formyl-CoA transferase/CoA:oxalate CoA-transferase
MLYRNGACAPLQGVQVLDLTRAVTGPFCTMMLGDFGARIIKIEEPRTGDETCHWGPLFVEGESAYFLSLNRNKESVVLDFGQEDDVAALRRLAGQSDVVIQNFRPGVAERLQVDYRTLSAGNPGLIYASISGFGLTGPDCRRPGYDLIVQAMSGMMLTSGWEGVPVKACFPISDIMAGQFAANAILAALYERQKSGAGAHLEVSLLEALLFAMPGQAANYLLTGNSPTPQGTNNASIAPYQLLQCQDALLAVGVPNDRIWLRFCEALGRPDWSDDERYRSNQRRIENRDELIEQIEPVMRAKTSAEWQQILNQHQVPCGPLLSIGEAIELPQVQARGNVVTVEHPKAGPIRLLRNPIRFAGCTMEYRPPPALGEHTDAVLEEFGVERAPER